MTGSGSRLARRCQPIQDGRRWLLLTAGVIIAASLASRLADQIGLRVPLLIGPGAMLTGLAWLLRLTLTSGYVDILGPLPLISFGIGLQFVPSTLIASLLPRGLE